MKLKYLTLALCALPLSAMSTDTTNIISFSTEITQEVQRDVLQITLFTQMEHENLATLNKTINEKINQALKIVNKQSAVNILENSRNTHVRYSASGKNTGKQNGWISRAQLVLESQDTEALSKILSELGGILAIDNVSSNLSDAKLQTLEDEMLKGALKKFEHKAQLIQTSLQAKGYKILDLNVQSISGQYQPQPRMYAASYAKEMNVSDYTQLETGKTNVKTRIDARIELIKD